MELVIAEYDNTAKIVLEAQYCKLLTIVVGGGYYSF